MGGPCALRALSGARSCPDGVATASCHADAHTLRDSPVSSLWGVGDFATLQVHKLLQQHGLMGALAGNPAGKAAPVDGDTLAALYERVSASGDRQRQGAGESGQSGKGRSQQRQPWEQMRLQCSVQDQPRGCCCCCLHAWRLRLSSSRLTGRALLRLSCCRLTRRRCARALRPTVRPAAPALPPQYRSDPDCLDRICEALPVPATHKQVAGWLRKQGLMAAKPRSRRPRDPDGTGEQGRA